LIHPVTEEVESLTKGLKGKHSAGYDDTPECIVKQMTYLKCIVKQCIQLVRKPLTNSYDESLNFGVFPNEWKTAKVKPLCKKGDT
jgi:hypothetical protein